MEKMSGEEGLVGGERHLIVERSEKGQKSSMSCCRNCGGLEVGCFNQ